MLKLMKDSHVFSFSFGGGWLKDPETAGNSGCRSRGAYETIGLYSVQYTLFVNCLADH